MNAPELLRRPVRSVLYSPAANPRAMDKARAIPTDALIIDLEDAVAPSSKDAARRSAVETVHTGGFGDKIITIRCNGIGTPWGPDDIAAIASVAPDAMVIPKVSNVDELRRYDEALLRAGSFAMRLWPMIETPVAILNARELALHPRVDTLVIGTNDLLLELRAVAQPGRAGLVAHLAHAVLAARAAGVRIVDGVFNDINDAEGFLDECHQGVELGFDGKTLIHPSQVLPCNAAWSPTAAQIEQAEKVIAAFEAATARNEGVATIDGRLIEQLHVTIAERTLAIARHSQIATRRIAGQRGRWPVGTTAPRESS